MNHLTLLAAAAAAAILAGPCAQAHITIEPASASAGAYQKLTFRVGHGCAGSATNSIAVTLPDGIAGAKPMPKPGWAIATVDGKLATPVVAHGVTITSAVREVRWQGGSLPDAQYDEFSMQVKLPDAAGKVYFTVLQVCETGSAHWRDVPAAPGAALTLPAPVLEVVPAAGAVHQH